MQRFKYGNLGAFLMALKEKVVVDEKSRELAHTELMRLMKERGVRPLYAVVTGAHMFGFPSHNSDLDLRGAFAYRTDDLLGLDRKSTSINAMLDTDPELDIDLKEIGAHFNLVRKPNMNFIEHVNSPHVIYTSPEHEDMKSLSNRCISKKVHPFYVGFVDKVLRDAEQTGIIKRHLYAMRLLLSGAHVLRTGEVVSDINVLNEGPRHALVDELVEAKKAGELATYKGDSTRIKQFTDELRSDFERAYRESPLPDSPPIQAVRDMNSYLIKFRREN
jgi:predicted nucleotidyltransferase